MHVLLLIRLGHVIRQVNSLFELYNKIMNVEDKADLGKELRKQSRDVENYTFRNDSAYRLVKIFNPIYKTFSKPIDMKFSRSSDFSVKNDAPTYRAMFRPDLTLEDVNEGQYDKYGNPLYNIQNGAIIYIENEETNGFTLHSEDETEEEYALNDGCFWMLAGSSEDGYLTQYYLVLCDYLLKWIYNGEIYTSPICIRASKSYTDGIYTVTEGSIADFIDNQIGFLCPLNTDTQYLDMGDRFFISFNNEHPSIFRITKMESGLKKGILSCTLVQDEYNNAIDDKVNKLCNVNKIPKIEYELKVLNGSSIELDVGDKEILNIQLNKTVDGITSIAGTEDVVINSKDNNIVTVDGNLITAIDSGVVEVEVIYKDIIETINISVVDTGKQSTYEALVQSDLSYIMYNGVAELYVKLYKDGVEITDFEYDYKFNDDSLVQFADKDEGNLIIIQANNSKIKGVLTTTVTITYDNQEFEAVNNITIGGTK